MQRACNQGHICTWGSSIIRPGKSGSRHVLTLNRQPITAIETNAGFLIFKSLANAENQYRPK